MGTRQMQRPVVIFSIRIFRKVCALGTKTNTPIAMTSFHITALYSALLLLLLSAAVAEECLPRLSSLSKRPEPNCSDGRQSISVVVTVDNGCIFRSQEMTLCFSEKPRVWEVRRCVRADIQACTDDEDFEACAQKVFDECKGGFTFTGASSSISSSRECCRF
ncbi:unnamed protein product [Chondrus crispus]|uniref:Uncharacterized protein n=1 Tax=Chondrus crispus TaxID=2769 RepID=R7QDF9_CHOCR|nr:unnamed protein product [Chondrus crispus]CDF36537.1 unnamed protein product [Chondrus crispus]|eukprot:XP_005716356.1 unnamed protein product [Chondrus crispus]